MKRVLILFACILSLSISAHAQDNSNFQQGPMAITSNSKLTVGGVIIEKELWDQYFSPEDLAAFKSGKTLETVGGIISCVGAFPLGFGAGYMIGWKIGGGPSDHRSYKAATTCLLVGLGITAVGLAIGIPGTVKMRNAVKNYNMSLSYQPELRFGNTPNGVGIAFAF